MAKKMTSKKTWRKVAALAALPTLFIIGNAAVSAQSDGAEPSIDPADNPDPPAWEAALIERGVPADDREAPRWAPVSLADGTFASDGKGNFALVDINLGIERVGVRAIAADAGLDPSAFDQPAIDVDQDVTDGEQVVDPPDEEGAPVEGEAIEVGEEGSEGEPQDAFSIADQLDAFAAVGAVRYVAPGDPDLMAWCAVSTIADRSCAFGISVSRANALATEE